jgi:hypothetical protein
MTLDQLTAADLTDIRHVLHHVEDRATREHLAQVIGAAIRAKRDRPAYTFQPLDDGWWLIGLLGQARRVKPRRHLAALWPAYLAIIDPGSTTVRPNDFTDPASTHSDDSVRNGLPRVADWLEHELKLPDLAREIRSPRMEVTDTVVLYRPTVDSHRINPAS